MAIILFLKRCDNILRNFAKDDISDYDPLPKERIDEITYALDVLASLKVSPLVMDYVIEKYKKQQFNEIINLMRRSNAIGDGMHHEKQHVNRERTHLLFLYGALCECVKSKETSVRNVVSELLDILGTDMNLLSMKLD